MREIGVTELNATLSATLRSVARGEEVRVTVRGRPVANIVPVREDDDERMRRLIAEGRITPATKPMPRHPTPLSPGRRSATAIVLAEREAERSRTPPDPSAL